MLNGSSRLAGIEGKLGRKDSGEARMDARNEPFGELRVPYEELGRRVEISG